MNILLSGVSGLVGQALVKKLKDQHNLFVLVRRAPKNENEIQWDPANKKLDLSDCPKFDASIHLSGYNIACLWNDKKKKIFRDSRLNTTQLLADTFKQMADPPKTFICASAIGIYGDQGDHICNEDSPATDDFMATLCVDWEAAAQSVSDICRVVNLRIGLVLAREDGALKRMLPPFKFGLGGRLGNGKQYYSWVANHDLVRIIEFAMNNESIVGPINCVSPDAVTNLAFTKTLGKVIKRPTIFPVPAFFLKLVLGEFAERLLLSSIRVYPKKLLDAGFVFEFEKLEDAFKELTR